MSAGGTDQEPVRGPGSKFDAVTMLTIYIAALFGIESRLVVRPLGGVGQPAELVALLGLGWWMYFQVQRTYRTRARSQPVRIALIAVVCCFLASYVAAASRPISSGEYSLANIGIVVLFGWAGAVLLANDGIPSIERYEQFMGRLVLAGGLIGLLGILQFFAHSSLLQYLAVPGLSANATSGTILARAGFARPSGTALHPIEYGAVLAMILPIAIVRARSGTRGAVRSWLPPTLIALAVLMCGSRSALICAAIVVVVLASAWSVKERWATAGLVLVLLAGVSVAIPRMLGTLLHLFTRIDSDPSVSSRTGSYDLVSELIKSSPIVGRGFRTLSVDYRILDNQYLDLLIEVGVLGLLAVVGLLVTAVVCAQVARRRSADPMIRAYGQALTASVIAGGVGLALYDGFAFPMASSTLFLVIGLSGGLLRLTTRQRNEMIAPRAGDEVETSSPVARERRSSMS